MADIQFTDNYVRLQQSLGNQNIKAWRTPTGEVYYGATARVQPVASVPSISTTPDVTLPPTAAPTAPTAPIVAQTTQKVQDASGDTRNIMGGAGGTGSLFDFGGEDTPPTQQDLLAEHEQYMQDQASITAAKDFIDTPLGKAAMAASPLLAGVATALKTGWTPMANIRSGLKESRSQEALDTFHKDISSLLGDESLSNDDFWDQAEARMAAYDARNTGRTAREPSDRGKTATSRAAVAKGGQAKSGGPATRGGKRGPSDRDKDRGGRDMGKGRSPSDAAGSPF